MSDYRYPYQDGLFVLNELVGLKQLCIDAGLEEFAEGLAEAVLDEAGKLGSEVLAPLNAVGDRSGATLSGNQVLETEGFSEAYQQFCQGGWPSLAANPDFGGQGLPAALSVAVNEIWQSANLSWALCPLLTQGAIEALEVHGDERLKSLYLAKLVSGEWVGTMNLTEPDAGTDLAAIKTRAVPNEDHYLLSGQKIFITWGDHQMTENIAHLMLARLPEAPAGVKGISLFLVPKFLLDSEGNLTDQRNDVYPVSLEHKLGIHGSPTCVMSFGDNGGAVGYLVGEAHKGLACMFTMMNDARQSVGLQGLAVSERAYQHALQYARERIQGTAPDGSGMAIIQHPDVRRMLMQMKALNQAMRAFAYVARAESDRARNTTDMDSVLKHKARSDLYTPVVKGWLTEIAQEVTSLAVQVHGGMGYIEETGVAQYYRDARILPIYEGTNGIQALDLIGRKTVADDGQALSVLLEEIESDLLAISDSQLTDIVTAVREAVTHVNVACNWVLQQDKTQQTLGSVSFNFMMMTGYLCGGWMLAKSADIALQKINAEDADNSFLDAKITTARFYCEQILPRVSALHKAVLSGSDTTMKLQDEQF